MTYLSYRIFHIAAFGCCLVAVCVAQQPSTAPTKKGKAPRPDNGTISVTRFGDQNVIGFLGHPLGTIVRVTGVAVDGYDTGFKADVGKLLLSVQTVDGTELPKPVVFEFLSASRSVVKPSPGDDFDYYVHEYGEFDGVVEPPAELEIAYEKVAHDGFHYRPYVTVHKSLK